MLTLVGVFIIVALIAVAFEADGLALLCVICGVVLNVWKG